MNIKLKSIFASLFLVSILCLLTSSAFADTSYRMMNFHNNRQNNFFNNRQTSIQNQNHIQRRLNSVNNSNVEGIVDLFQLPNESGTHITVMGFGLQPNHQYVSLYYSNHVCQLEPYSVDDVIGGIYTANSVGVGLTQANQQDNLDEINSVSIRNAATFSLLACANIH